MSATYVPAGPDSDIGRLLQEFGDSADVQLRVDSGDNLFIVWLSGKEHGQCGCHADQWLTAQTDRWTLMAKFEAIRRIRFVREPDGHAPGHESLSIRLVGDHGGSSLRADFRPLYDAQDQPIARPFAHWEELRARYGGRDELVVENGAIVSAGAPPETRPPDPGR